ncbi:uncharacterized protein LOC123890971 [Trifolium pratense]|uniref:uncharacterized protein LOC123890971 n=1 Tax=Trifolium pratense TaxID=57577 RepID=UPI001E693850|nr:uncharacterized protein LOC123890971 [Trifolium pratense]XP_045796695.1 uncharacterized protein LOC123890971 [Trifolium pratense]
MRRMAVNWANLEDFPLSLVLDKLEEHIDHVRFGAVCKNWLSIAKLSHQNHQFRVNIPPMVMIVGNESFNSKRISLHSILSQKHYSIQFPSIKFQVTCAASFGWLSFVHDNGDITLLNPFKYTSIPPISLPPLGSSSSKSLCMVTLSADPITSPNDYDIAAIYDLDHLALKRANQPFWIPILNNPTPRRFSFTDVVFHKGLIVAADLGHRIVSFKLNNLPPDDLNDPNFTYYEKLATTEYYNHIPSQDYCGFVYLVKSLHGDLWLVRRNFEIILNKLSYTIDVYELELDVQNGKLVQINKLDSLGDNILFIGFCGDSFSVPTSCLPNCKKDSIFFLCGNFMEDFGMGIYNVEDGSCQRLSLPLSSELMQYSWIVPQFQWD